MEKKLYVGNISFKATEEDIKRTLCAERRGRIGKNNN